jgi:histidinol dehydrogenase
MRILEWKSLSAAERGAALLRPAQRDAEHVIATAREIIAQVRSGGDTALRTLSEKFDAAVPEALQVSSKEFDLADRKLDADQHAAIERAISSIRSFHSAQSSAPLRIETFPGVVCERISVPIRAAGMYVPAGSAPLPSTAIMLAVPAALAACPIRVMCTPPSCDGAAHPAVLVAARKAGVGQVFKVGGAQAVAAMAYGTDTIPKCDKIFGPGNSYVTAAKMLVAQDPAGAAQDLPAGPSEVMIIADESARAEFVAADLLAQAEHSPDAQALLLTTHRALAEAVREAVRRQCPRLTRAAILAQSVRAIRLIVVESLDTALHIADSYAPEHLILEVREPRTWVPRISTAGAVFLGHWSPESAGDYCSGPNHTLPTYGFGRAHSGLSLEDFQRRFSIQELTPAGLRALAATTRILSQLEGLDAHAAAITMRLEALN